jgi:NAD(P)-dependent dehydrogenase (short-subunit alcohol dehydrogenase family)
MTEIDVEDQAGGYTDEDIEGRVPMGRFARPEDVAGAVAFLADPEQSAFVNGHTSLWTAACSATGAGRARGGASNGRSPPPLRRRRKSPFSS